MTAVRWVRLDDAGMQHHVALAATEYPGAPPSDTEHFRWKHLDTPSGSSFAAEMRDASGTLVGRVLVAPRTLNLASGTMIPAGVAMDMLIRSDARSATTFADLIRTARTNPDLDVVLHTSNANSDLLYRRLMGYKVAFELDAYGMIVGAGGAAEMHGALGLGARMAGRAVGIMARVAAPLVRALAGLRFTAERPTEDSIVAVERGFARYAGAHLARGVDRSVWRSGVPGIPGTVYWVMHRGVAMGYVVLAMAHVGDTQALVIQDAVFGRLPRWREGLAVRAHLLALGASQRASVVLGLWNDANPMAQWMRGIPFVHVPASFLPHETPIFAAVADTVPDAAELAGMFMSVGDLDYF